MDITAVQKRLDELDQIMATHTIDSPAFSDAAHEQSALMFRDIPIRETQIIARNMSTNFSNELMAKMIVAAHDGKPLSDVLDMPIGVKVGYLVRWGRRQKDLSQAQLAEQLDMTQSQIAKIESAANGVTAEVMGKLAKALDVTFTITPNDPVLNKTNPKKAS